MTASPSQFVRIHVAEENALHEVPFEDLVTAWTEKRRALRHTTERTNAIAQHFSAGQLASAVWRLEARERSLLQAFRAAQRFIAPWKDGVWRRLSHEEKDLLRSVEAAGVHIDRHGVTDADAVPKDVPPIWSKAP